MYIDYLADLIQLIIDCQMDAALMHNWQCGTIPICFALLEPSTPTL